MTSMAPGVSMRRRIAVLASTFVGTALLLVLVQAVGAQASRGNPLDQSAIAFSPAQVRPGDLVDVGLVIDNDGSEDLPHVVMTNDLPEGLQLMADSADASGEGDLKLVDGRLFWEGALPAGAQVAISFSALVSTTMRHGMAITTSAVISGGGFLAQPVATLTVFTETLQYFPVMYQIPPTVMLDDIPQPNSNNTWTLTWTPSTGVGITGYEIEEAQNASFTQGVTVYSTGATSLQITKPTNGPNEFYYRVRALGAWGTGPWSNVERRVGIYRDDFTGTTTNWQMRRQDTDDVDNDVYAENGHLVLEMNSRWDYLIASPLVPAVEPPYKIETRVRFSGVDNLHTYGIIFGGDWNGQTCPNANYSSCYNHYYRLSMIWYGAVDRLRTHLKRIDYHDPADNAGRGPSLWGPSDINVAPPPATWQTWTITVRPNGKIELFVNGNFITSVTDDRYINDPYFGMFAATDEYTGLDIWVDWYQVTPLS